MLALLLWNLFLLRGDTVVNSDAMVRDIVTQIICKHWPEKVDLDAGNDNSGNQYFGEAWRFPGRGCDTLEHMVDDLVSVTLHHHLYQMASLVIDSSKQVVDNLDGDDIVL